MKIVSAVFSIASSNLALLRFDLQKTNRSFKSNQSRISADVIIFSCYQSIGLAIRSFGLRRTFPDIIIAQLSIFAISIDGKLLLLIKLPL
jgi:hypothetical protein